MLLDTSLNGTKLLDRLAVVSAASQWLKKMPGLSLHRDVRQFNSVEYLSESSLCGPRPEAQRP